VFFLFFEELWLWKEMVEEGEGKKKVFVLKGSTGKGKKFILLSNSFFF